MATMWYRCSAIVRWQRFGDWHVVVREWGGTTVVSWQFIRMLAHECGDVMVVMVVRWCKRGGGCVAE